MKNRLLASFRGLMAVLLTLFATNFLPVAVGAATIEFTPESNNATYWQNSTTGTCVKVDGNGTDTTYTLPTASAGTMYTLLVLKGGTLNETYTNPVAGTAYSTSTNPNNNKPYGLSHVIYCYKTTTQTISVPATPNVTDLCGTGNASWVKPADTAQVTWTLSGGNLVAHTTTGYVFTGGMTTHDYGQAVETNTDACPPEVQTISVPATPNVTDLCGTGNASWVKPADTAQVTWTLSGGNLVAHTTTGYVFTGGMTTHDYGQAVETNTDACPQEEKKVFVCKYVGTPGVDERLQTGNNPISVSVNSLKDFNGIGSFFNDAQGRSFALAYDVGQDEPSIDECEAPAPTKVTPAVVFTNPTCENPLGRVTVTAVEGVTYKVNGSVVTGTTTYAAGSSVTVTTEVADGFVLADEAQSTFQHNFTAAPTDCVLGEVTPPMGGQGGDVLGATTVLANTGEGSDNALTSVIVGLVGVMLAIGMTVLSRKHTRA